MTRRVIDAVDDPNKIDDKDYYGNKRLELAGDLVSLLFEDAIWNYEHDLRLLINREFSRSKKWSESFMLSSLIIGDRISDSIANSISTGNWKIKRFKMDW